MNAILRRARQAEAEPFAAEINGEPALCDPSGALFLPERETLVASDLHLEKGAAFARRGMMLPPYDTAATLALLVHAIERYAPRTVICLGDSFHDRNGAALMPDGYRAMLRTLMVGRDWVWVLGNHDPEPPAGLGGDAAAEIALGPLRFRHGPTAGFRAGEVAGHLHPVARVAKQGRSVRGACFATDGARLVMPSFGVTTGGLNVLDAPFAGLFMLEAACAFVIGQTRIYPVRFAALSRG